MLLALRHCGRNLRPQSLLQWRPRHFTVLALESSADDTCAAVVTSDRKILSNVVIRQLDKHEMYGGIEPGVAMMEHQKNMPLAIREALDTAKMEVTDIDGFAFTRGPGMPGSLSVCLTASKNLAAALKKPLIGVHHMQAHALTAILTAKNADEMPTFPFLALLISGGHTLLVLVLGEQRFRIIASTIDEAVGAAIDSVARSVRVKWEGRSPGAALEALANNGLPGLDVRDIPHIDPPNLPFCGSQVMKFSFSGIHSWADSYVLRYGLPAEEGENETLSQTPRGVTKLHKILCLPDPHRVALARAFLEAAFTQLEGRVVYALKKFNTGTRGDYKTSRGSANEGDGLYNYNIKHVVVSGGVASNVTFRKRLDAALRKKFPKREIKLLFPPPELCTDNAAMIGWASMHRFMAGESDDYTIRHANKWSLEELVI